MTMRLPSILRLAVLISLPLAFCPALFAQAAPAAPAAGRPGLTVRPGRPGTPAGAVLRSNLLARTGGIIQAPATGPAFLFLDAQTRVEAAAIGGAAEQIGRALRLSVASRAASAPQPPAALAAAALADTGTAAVVVVGDVAGQPSLLVAPENRWAVVNVAALAADGAAPEVLAERTRKELWRAFGYLMGAGHASRGGCLMQSVRSNAELDALTAAGISLESYGRIMAHAKTLGLEPRRTASYRKAVEDGWAPAPTNAAQKAIWDEVKAGK